MGRTHALRHEGKDASRPRGLGKSMVAVPASISEDYKTKPFSGWVRFNLSAPDVDAVDTLVVLNVIKRCGVAGLSDLSPCVFGHPMV